MTRWLQIFLLAFIATGIGCDQRSAAPSATNAPPPPPRVEHPGRIVGRILFVAKPPELARLNTSGDSHCQRLHPDGLPDESVVVAGDGELANVLVYLEDAPRCDGSRRSPGLIDQVGCQYVPHVVAVQINQPLRVKSSDPVLHNVHILAVRNPAANLSETGVGEQTIRFASPEIMHVRCDVHPWMKAIVAVLESPWFAVTAADGKFEITGVPPGVYTLAAWHERLGQQTRKITVLPDATVQADYSYGK